MLSEQQKQKAMELMSEAIAKAQNFKPTFKQKIKKLIEKLKELCKKN
jgi:hypothetical protein